MDCCGNCLAPFKDKSTKVKQISPRNINEGDERTESVSIYEALSIIFEVPPLTSNDAGGDGSVISKRDVFRKGSLFTFGEKSASFAICVNCSEVLADLYSCFEQFTKVCKLKSEVGRILKAIENGGEKQAGNKAGGDENSENKRASRVEGGKPRLEIFNVTVKTEREEEEQSEGDQHDDYMDGGDDSPSSHGLNDDDEIEINNGITVKAPPDSDEDCHEANHNADQENRDKLCAPRKSERSRRKTEKMVLGDSIALDDSDSDMNHPAHRNSESDDEYVPPIRQKENLKDPTSFSSIKTSLPTAKSPFSQFQCPHCPKKFLHENTLLCHRRIVHRDPIKILPPNPRPQVPPNKTEELSHSEALANSNGQTSSCPICRLEIPRAEIRHHLSNHTRSLSKPWLCTICGVNCTSQRDLNHHSRTHVHGIPCQRCFKKIPTYDMLNHIRRCAFNQIDDLRCKICRKKFETQQLLDIHTIKVHAHSWRCKLCGIKFTQRDKMQQHMLAHKQKKSNKCKICDKLFDRLDVLRLHVKRFHRNNDNPPTPSVPKTSEHGSVADDGGAGDDHSFGGDDFEAPSSPILAQPKSQYTKKKDSKAASDSFVEALSKENRFACQGCDFQCPTASNLDDHLAEVHTNEETLTCKICDRQLQDAYCLKLHVKTHGEIKPFECFDEACGKVYRDKSSFFYHLKEKHNMDGKQIIGKYSGIYKKLSKDYSIRYIKKKYAQQKYSNPKNEGGKFPCEFCGKVFPKMYAVRNHIKIVHDKVKDFLCKYCGKAFARRSYFMVHERLHTSNETPYKCHLCDKAFRLPGNLKMHLKSTIHNASRDYVCEICGKGFNRNDNLRLHVKTVHMKIQVRKPRGEKSDRYTHGGRNRIYVVNPSENEDSNVADTTSKEEPVAGTSQSFYHQQTHEQNPTHAISGLSMPVLVAHQESSPNQHQSSFQQQGEFLERGFSYR